MKNNYDYHNFGQEFIITESHFDKKPPPWENNFYNPISLWEIMIKAHAEKWAGIIGALSRHHAKISNMGNGHIEESFGEELNLWLKTALGESELLKLHSGVKKAIGRTQKAIIQGDTTAISKELARTVQVIFDALDGIMFLHIKPGSIKYYNEKQLFGPDVEQRFPQEVLDDIEEAGKCFALNRYTACVFHLMRVMESGVQKLGDKLDVPLANEKCWDRILKDSRTEINAKYTKSNPENVKWKTLLVKLETVKDAWRNPTMHPKASYTEEHAEEIWFAVKIFMRELAKIL